jgi:triosephosphate isomerase
MLFGETDGLIGKKVASALASGLTPVLCVGEQLGEREQGRAESVVESQLRSCLDGIDAPEIVVAYEPVWAIGTGRAATPDDAQTVMAHIRKVLGKLYGGHHASGVPLLYGGSVSADNAASFVREADIDGALVGGASLRAESFVALVANASEAMA